MTATAAMIFSCGAISVPRRPSRRRFCSAADTDQLRTEIDRLHAEAETTRSKASNARLRLLRLSEAAEKLRRQAALSVRKGNEDDARELLFQKKKVMEALENSKSRIELLDELCGELNEAISMKETQLIGNIAMDLQVGRESEPGAVHIVSPKDVSSEVPDHNEEYEDESDLQMQVNFSRDEDLGNSEGPSLTEYSSYDSFLIWFDDRLKKLEGELISVIRSSALEMEKAEISEKEKIQQILEFFEIIRDIRKRISSIMQQKVETI